MSDVITIKDLNAWYDHLQILKGVNIKVKKGELVSLIGPNGAGKSTVLKSIFGLVTRAEGEILYWDENIINLQTHEVVKRGICFVPQGRSVFPSLTVLENIQLGAYIRKDDISEDIEKVFKKFPRLEERKYQKAGLLSGGEQQMVSLGRALMLKPKLMLLDEPSLGLSHKLKREIFAKIKEIVKSGTTVLMVEQNAHLALELSDRTYVLETGKNRLEGKSSALLKNKEVQKLYLGGR